MQMLTQFPELWACGVAGVPFFDHIDAQVDPAVRDDLRWWDLENCGDIGHRPRPPRVLLADQPPRPGDGAAADPRGAPATRAARPARSPPWSSGVRAAGAPARRSSTPTRATRSAASSTASTTSGARSSSSSSTSARADWRLGGADRPASGSRRACRGGGASAAPRNAFAGRAAGTCPRVRRGAQRPPHLTHVRRPTMSRSDTEQEIRETLGQVPSFFESMPDSTLENEWREFKVFQLADTVLTRPREAAHRLRRGGRHPLPVLHLLPRERDHDDGHDRRAARRGRPHGQRDGQVQHLPARPAGPDSTSSRSRPTRSASTWPSRPAEAGRLRRRARGLRAPAATTRRDAGAGRRAASQAPAGPAASPWTSAAPSGALTAVSRPMNVRVYVTPKQGILDPQGAAVERSLPALGFDGVSGVRIGKIIELTGRVPTARPPRRPHARRSTTCAASCSPTPSSRTTPSPSTRREPDRPRSPPPASDATCPIMTRPAARPVRVGVVVFPGINTDRDTAPRGLHLRRRRPVWLWHKDTDLQRRRRASSSPAASSYGDYLRCGAIARFSPIMQSDRRLRRRRRPGDGHLQRLPDPDRGRPPARRAASATPASSSSAATSNLRVENAGTPFTSACSPGDVLRIVVKHNEGNYTVDPATLATHARQRPDRAALLPPTARAGDAATDRRRQPQRRRSTTSPASATRLATSSA